jgi:hypothetical protein
LLLCLENMDHFETNNHISIFSPHFYGFRLHLTHQCTSKDFECALWGGACSFRQPRFGGLTHRTYHPPYHPTWAGTLTISNNLNRRELMTSECHYAVTLTERFLL